MSKNEEGLSDRARGHCYGGWGRLSTAPVRFSEGVEGVGSGVSGPRTRPASGVGFWRGLGAGKSGSSPGGSSVYRRGARVRRKWITLSSLTVTAARGPRL